MKRILTLAALAVVVVSALWWAVERRNPPVQVAVTKVVRQTLISSVTTNGKVEPLEWVSVSAERSGVVERVLVERGQQVVAGQVLVEMDTKARRVELEAAQARLELARVELAVLEAGGRAAERAQLEGELAEARLELEAASKERAAVERLLARGAATKLEAEEAARRVAVAEARIKALEERRAALAGKTDREAAVARVREAEAAVAAARLALEQAVLRSPVAGVVYELNARPGMYLNLGDVVARVGRIEKIRVRVYVDEPELGRVQLNQPVIISWDALGGREWRGSVERLPTEITPVGTRQVGEVVCVIENPAGELLPGANVNVEIRTQVVENALVIPREALRMENNEQGVLVVSGDKLSWKRVVTGANNITHVEIREGLAEGDVVALAAQRALTAGLRVRPVWR